MRLYKNIKKVSVVYEYLYLYSHYENKDVRKEIKKGANKGQRL